MKRTTGRTGRIILGLVAATVLGACDLLAQDTPDAAPSLPRGSLPDTLAGRPGTYYYYHGLDYGSQSLVHPLRLILNGGFGIMQIENRDNRPAKVMYGRGMRNVADNLVRPWWSIGEDGFWDFLTREVIPISVNRGQAQYWPNYMNHLLGGGMSYRLMEEYYRYHGRSRSGLWAGGTIFVYHFLNEVVENNDRLGPSVDPVADFWIFNSAGVWLFNKEWVARFFATKLHMNDWSYQPTINPETGELQNNGQNYVMKYHLNRAGSRSIFYHWGTHAELGLSFTDSQGRCLSFGVGLIAKNLLDIDELAKTVDLAVSGGVFYDRNNSLLVGLQFARTKDYAYRLNLYPGLVRLGPLRPGFFAALDQDDHLSGGITFGSLHHMPVGLGLDF
ncbi:MAG: hypothetical protein AB7V45_11285 [Candidatus Krumholzibacteriia bacterium]